LFFREGICKEYTGIFLNFIRFNWKIQNSRKGWDEEELIEFTETIDKSKHTMTLRKLCKKQIN